MTHDHADDQIEAVPGTVHLVDAEGDLKSKHGSGSDRDIVLVPAPSSHPDDPLNWSQRRKLTSAMCMAVYVLITGICSSALYSTLYPLSQETGLSVANLNEGTGYMFLFFGWGCVFWQAVALQYGRRPVYLISLLGTMGTMLWQPHISTNGQWVGAKILQGFFGAPIEALGEVTISDVFFTHERGRYMALYALALGYSNGIAPLIMGFIANGQPWQWVFHWCAIFCAGAFLLLFFFGEETKFNRSAADGQGLVARQGRVDADTEAASKAGDGSTTRTEMVPQMTNTSVASHVRSDIPKKGYLARLSPVSRTALQANNRLLTLMSTPFVFFTYPIVVFTGFMYGCNIVWLSVLNATQSLVLSNPPYNMSTSTVGLTFIAPLIGTTLASLYTGVFGDWCLVKMSRRNKGYFEAEFRLWLFLASLVLIPFGCILWGVGAYHHIHWFGLVFAMGTISFTTTAGSQISVAYCVDCYRDLSAEALATVMIIRNTMSFGIGYGVTPWVTGMGYQNAFIVGACAGFAHTLAVFPIIKWGPGLRAKTAVRYWRRLEKESEENL